MSRQRHKHHFFRNFLVFLLLVAGVGGFIIYKNTDWFYTKKVVPPFPTMHDCTAVATEVAKYNWDTGTALAVAKAESDCNAEARGDDDISYEKDGRKYGYSVGAFQIRILPGREDCDSYDIEKNVACAYDVYKEKGNFEPWSGYTTGKYKLYFWHSIL